MANLDDKKLNEMLDHVLSLEPAEQKKYLEALDQNDPELGRKIKDLITYCEADVPQDFLQPSSISADMIRQVYNKLKAGRNK